MNIDDLRCDPAKLAGVVWDFHTKLPTPDNKPHPTHLCMRIVPLGSAFWSARAEALETFSIRGQIPAEVMQRVTGEVHARVSLVDWWNLEMGTPPLPVPYSVEKATELLTDPRWTLVRRFVESACHNETALLARREEEASGN